MCTMPSLRTAPFLSPPHLSPGSPVRLEIQGKATIHVLSILGHRHAHHRQINQAWH